MSGAYVAEPAATTSVDYPPNWNLTWPFPGPDPPGFDWRGYEWPGLPGGGKPEDDAEGDPRILVYPISGLETHENDDSIATKEAGTFFYVRLTAKPTGGAIRVPITSSDTSEGIPYLCAYLDFNNDENWDKPKKVYLAGVNDDIEDGDVSYTIQVGPSTSSHGAYCGLSGSDVSATNIEIKWALTVTLDWTHDASVFSNLAHASGYAEARSWFKVEGPATPYAMGDWANAENREYLYYHPTTPSHTVTTTITGTPASFETFTGTFALSKTGVEGNSWRVQYGISAMTYNSAWFHDSGAYAIANSAINIFMTLYKDGEVVDTASDTLTAYSEGTYDSDSGYEIFLAV